MKSIVYKGKKYGQRHVINNIKREFNGIVGPRKGFYSEALAFCEGLAKKHGYTKEQSAGVVAALSPMKEWGYNKVLADKLLSGEKIGHTKVQIGKALKILQTDTVEDIATVLGGTKTTNFFKNILGIDTVTIDRHAVNLALNGLVYDGLGDAAYEFFSQCYNKAASELGLRASELQSATWYSWREKNQYKKR